MSASLPSGPSGAPLVHLCAAGEGGSTVSGGGSQPLFSAKGGFSAVGLKTLVLQAFGATCVRGPWGSSQHSSAAAVVPRAPRGATRAMRPANRARVAACAAIPDRFTRRRANPPAARSLPTRQKTPTRPSGTVAARAARSDTAHASDQRHHPSRQRHRPREPAISPSAQAPRQRPMTNNARLFSNFLA